MSHATSVDILIEDIDVLVRAIADLGMSWRRDKTMQTSDGRVHEVEGVAVEPSTGREVGLARNEKGERVLVPQQCADEKSEALAKKVVQRYAYTKAVDGLKREGYQVVKEEVQRDGSVRIVARRWG